MLCFIQKHAVYDGGGYVLDLTGSFYDLLEKIKELRENRWTDSYTRAVFVEFTVYNVQANLFVVVTMLCEYIDAAGYWVSYR